MAEPVARPKLGSTDERDSPDEITAELRRRLAIIDSPEYRASACYQVGDRTLLEVILWLVVAIIIAVVTLIVWV